MTEDDTFRKLSQRPFEEVSSAYSSESIKQLLYLSRYEAGRDNYKFDFEKYGWTEKEFFKRKDEMDDVSIRRIISSIYTR